MDVFAVVVILFLCLIAVAGCIALAMRSAEQHGWVSVRAIGAIFASIVVTLLAVWAVVVTFDAQDAGAKVGVERTYAGTAGNAGPVTSAGVASNGTCDSLCLLAVVGRQGGAAN